MVLPRHPAGSYKDQETRPTPAHGCTTPDKWMCPLRIRLKRVFWLQKLLRAQAVGAIP